MGRKRGSMKILIAALVVAGLGAATFPAEAGGRHRHGPGCGHQPQQCGGYSCQQGYVEVEQWVVRRHVGTLIVPRGQLIVPHDGSAPIFIPRSGPPVFIPR